MRNNFSLWDSRFIAVGISLFACQTYAQTVPGPADIGRIETLDQNTLPKRTTTPFQIPESTSVTEIPEGAGKIHFTLEQLHIEEASVFSKKDMAEYYQQYLGKKISLSTVYEITNNITRHYRDAGYFLSRAYIPAQQVSQGHINIQVVEGYVGEIDIDETLETNHIVQRVTKNLKQHKPISAQQLESALLRLNDLAGINVFGTLQSSDNNEHGAVKLILSTKEQDGRGIVSVDNYGSRFLGPVQARIAYEDAFIPFQKTTLSASTSLPTDELAYAAFNHEIPLYPEVALTFSGGYVSSEPGSTLKSSDINSDSVELAVGATYTPIRQRTENLALSLTLDGRNSNSDIAGNTALTRDRVRAARLSIAYDTADNWYGSNDLRLTLSQGIGLFGASEDNDLNLSRAQADAEFTTFAWDYVRQQYITDSFMVVGQLSGQIASAPLFSSEEFGYGGQRFGRAYDPSEIIGDHGVAGGLELRYLGLDNWQNVQFTPYGYYDIGRVWNKDTGGRNMSASSAGIGMQAIHESNLYGNIGLAFPLTKEVSTPISGHNKNPRFLAQLGYQF